MEPTVEKAESIMDWNIPAKLSPDGSPCPILTEKRQKIKDPLKHFPGTQDMLCLDAPEKWTVKSSLSSYTMKQTTVGDSGSGHTDTASPHLSTTRAQTVSSLHIPNSKKIHSHGNKVKYRLLLAVGTQS